MEVPEVVYLRLFQYINISNSFEEKSQNDHMAPVEKKYNLC